MAKEQYSKMALVGLVILLLFAVYLIVRPFVSAIVGSFIIAFAFYPLYKKIQKVLRSRRISAGIVIAIILIFLIMPTVLIVNSLMKELVLNKIVVNKVISTIDLLEGECVEEGFICTAKEFLSEYIDETQLKFQISNMIDSTTKVLLQTGGEFIFRIPMFMLNFFVMIFVIFFLLLQGPSFAKKVQCLLPVRKKHRIKLAKLAGDVTYAVLFGHVVVAAFQGLLGGLALWIFGVSSPVLWGFVMFFFALIPFVGTPVVWLPAAIIKFVTGNTGQGIGLAISGLVISTIDNFIKPGIISGRADVHPVLVLLGVIGGLIAFGIFGVIIGPVLLAIAVKFIEIYEEEKLETTC